MPGFCLYLRYRVAWNQEFREFRMSMGKGTGWNVECSRASPSPVRRTSGSRRAAQAAAAAADLRECCADPISLYEFFPMFTQVLGECHWSVVCAAASCLNRVQSTGLRQYGIPVQSCGATTDGSSEIGGRRCKYSEFQYCTAPKLWIAQSSDTKLLMMMVLWAVWGRALRR